MRSSESCRLPVPGGTTIRLRIIEAKQPPVEYELDQSVVIVGRAPDCDVIVNHPYVSGRHLRLVCGVVVEDLGSSNGTFLDDQRIEGAQPIGNSRVTVGGPEIQLEVKLSGAAGDAALKTEIEGLRARLAELEQGQLGKTVAADPVTGEGESALLHELVRKDFKEFPPRLDGSVTDFYILESFRLLRQVEKVVTRMAGELTTKLKLETILPDVEGNFMALMAQIVQQPSAQDPRADLVEYLNQLRKWLFVSLGAYQRASVKYAEEIRATLSPMALTQLDPMPPLYRWFRQEEKILWRRARTYLDNLSRAHSEQRLDVLAKASAREMLGRNGRK